MNCKCNDIELQDSYKAPVVFSSPMRQGWVTLYDQAIYGYFSNNLSNLNSKSLRL